MKRFWTAATLGLMLLIFLLSAQPGEQSRSLSGKAAAQAQATELGKLVTPAWFSAANLNANLRKWAHVYLYAALGASTAAALYGWRGSPRLGRFLRSGTARAAAAAVLCLLYAASDELHQWFVPGRAALLSDVLLDFCGALPAIAAVTVLCAALGAARELPPHQKRK